MMDYSDRHFRYLMRLLAPHSWVFTEMVPAGAIVHGNAAKFLQFDAHEHPVVLQVGGNDPDELAQCAAMAQKWGYDEVNLNVGCPSGRVSAGRFGACLMKEPQRVAECVRAMQDEVSIPVSVKCRIGVDEQDSSKTLDFFVQTVADAGCRIFYVHARKALLSGLSPKQNRNIPPLDYSRVWALKRDFPQLTIVINGGIRTSEEAKQHLSRVDGVMVGRLAYENHWSVRQLEQELFPPSSDTTRHDIVKAYLPYLQSQNREGVPMARMTRHLASLFRGQPGARDWRRMVSNPTPAESTLHEMQEMAARIST